MAVGMGSGVNKAELNKITKGHAYTARTFKELLSDKFIRKLTAEACKVSRAPARIARLIAKPAGRCVRAASEAECRNAASYPNPSYRFVSTGRWSGTPAGCYVYPSSS